MIPLKGITICVNYGDLLRIVLARNMRFLSECLVVTSPEDDETRRIVAEVPGCRFLVTDAFTRRGATFNKGAAMEEGFEQLGRRSGWILIFDSDILFPDSFELPELLDQNTLYGAYRRILDDPRAWSPELDWKRAYHGMDVGFPGYFQLFNTAAAPLRARPWYDTSFVHAGGGDAYFEMRFRQKKRLGFEVLHLGPRDRNWFGRVSDRVDGKEIPISLKQKRQATLEAYQRSRGFAGKKRTGEPFQERIK